jgi:hypothetical protein
MRQLEGEIARLEDILNTGAETIVVDGVQTRFNVEAIRQRLRDLYRQRDGRGHVAKIDLSRGF